MHKSSTKASETIEEKLSPVPSSSASMEARLRCISDGQESRYKEKEEND